MQPEEFIDDWSTIVGQNQLVKNLKNALTHNKISHAYMIAGEKYSGKRMIANTFARSLQCEGEGEKPCNSCRSCKQAINGNHPDIIYVEHEKPNVISVENIRTQVNGDIAIKPYSGSHKVYIIDEAEKMNQQAMNALLKTLEEPPEYSVIILLTTSQEAMLQTIISRCVVLDVKPVSNDVIKNYLMQRMQIPDYRANVCASFARGNVGRAIQLSSNEDFDEMKKNAVSLFSKILDIEINEIASRIKDIIELKYDLNDYLDLCLIWYRDILILKSTKEKNMLVFSENYLELQRLSKKYSYNEIENIINEIDKTKNRIKANVNIELSLEILFMAMQVCA